MGGFQFQPKSLAAVVTIAFLLGGDNPPAASALHPYGFEKNSPIAFDSKVVGSRKMVAGREGSYGHVSLDTHHGKVVGLRLRLRSLATRRPSPPPPPIKNGRTSAKAKAFFPPPLLQ